MGGKTVFVTVGTTKFDKLIEKVSSDQILDILKSLGFSKVQFQIGTSKIQEKAHPKLELKYNSYFEIFLEQIESCDLVIGHAGAGTCIEVLRKQKPLIVVFNEGLMDNHQKELANQLAKEGYLKCCGLDSLSDVLLEQDMNSLNKYTITDSQIFSNYINKCMGFK